MSLFKMLASDHANLPISRMVNRENVLSVADALEKPRFPTLGFDYFVPYWGPDTGASTILPDRSGRNCETIADIWGWTISVMEGRPINIGDLIGGYLTQGKVKRRVQQFLGIDPITYEHLINASNHPMMNEGAREFEWLHHITVEQSVAVLRHLAETGEVVWK